MAPALVDRTVDDRAEAEATYMKNKRQEIYKEAFQQSATTTNYDTEINGSDIVKPAKYPHYLPYWNDVRRLHERVCCVSI